MTDDQKGRVLEGQIVPAAQDRQLRMPAETPFGIAILGIARYEALRRVIEARERTLRAAVLHIEGEIAVDEALRRRARAADNLANVQAEIDELRELESLKRQLERLRLEEQVEALKARKESATQPPSPKRTAQDDLIDKLRGLPSLVGEARKVKEEILRDKGQGLTSDDQDIISSIDAIVQAFVTKSAEEHFS